MVDDSLISWNTISTLEWESILLGNGFSINIWEKFGYGTLYDLAQQTTVDEPLTSECIALFSHINSVNFEDVLRILYHSKLVDEQLGDPQITQITSLYENTKNALASAVNYAHIPPNRADSAEINDHLKDYKNVFTTNYDLIPYWAIMNNDTWRFRDYFWNADGYFDIANVDAPENTTKIHYLHGAIHLVELHSGETQKLTANEIHSLSDLFDLTHPHKFPLIISEGSSGWKLSKIRRNDYLRFCYKKLTKIQNGLVVLGHSLHKDYDQHIIDAINMCTSKKVAVSIWSGLSSSEIISFKSRILQDLPEKEIYFFNSETHPLGDLKLNIPTP